VNIDSNIATTLFSNDVTGMASLGAQQGMQGSGQPGPVGSVFQLLISQMMAGKTQPETGEETGSQTPEGSNGIGAVLSELVSGRTLAAIRNLNIVGEVAKGNGIFEDAESSKDNSEAIEAVQALMGGLNNAFPASNIVRVLQENRDGKHLAEQPQITAGDGLTAIADAKVPETQTDLQNTLGSAGLAENGVPNVGKTDLQSGIAEPTGERIILQSGEVFQTGNKPITPEAGRPAGSEASALIQTISDPYEKGTPKAQNEIKAQALSPETDMETVSGSSQKSGFDEILKPHQSETGATATDELPVHNSVQAAAASGESAAVNQNARPAEAIEPHSQIRDEILTKLEKNGPTEFRMQLEPEDLGQIDIKLKLSEGKLMIDILAANTKTQALLTSQVDKLIAGMGLQNVQVESVQVSQQMNSQTQDNNQSQAFTMSSAMDFSQRKQQEQFQQQFISNGNPKGSSVFRQDDFSIENPANLTGLKGYDSHRMNYTV